MAFFQSTVGVLQTLVNALGTGLGIWGVVNLMEVYKIFFKFSIMPKSGVGVKSNDLS